MPSALRLRARIEPYLGPLSLGGYLFAAIVLGYFLAADGFLAYDARAYHLAGRNILEGVPLYAPSAVDELGAFKYPPLLAHLAAPFALLPEVVFANLLRLVGLLSLRVLAGSFRNVGLSLYCPLVLYELHLGNITLPLAAGVFLALRGSRWAAASLWLLGLAKFGPALAIPYVWRFHRASRRALVAGAAVTLAACGVSFVLAPGAYALYVESYTWQTMTPIASGGVIAILPVLWADALVRGGVALLLVAISLRFASPRAAFTATVIAVPVLAFSRLAPLLALPRLTRPQASGIGTVPAPPVPPAQVISRADGVD